MVVMTTATYADLPDLIALMTGDEKHDPASYSTLDVIRVLYDRVLRIPPRHPTTRPRPVPAVQGSRADGLLRGAAATAVSSTRTGSPAGAAPTRLLGHHPDRNLLPGVEISSGSLGHGLPLGVGSRSGSARRAIAAAGRRAGR